MKPSSTMFLRAAVWLMGLVVLALGVFVLPTGLRADGTGLYAPIIWGMYVTIVPFFVALVATLKLLSYIDQNTAFSPAAIGALRRIKQCALTIGGLYTVGLPYTYVVADRDDAPGVMAIGLVIVLAAVVVAGLAAVLQKLLQSAIDIKAENDLTV